MMHSFKNREQDAIKEISKNNQDHLAIKKESENWKKRDKKIRVSIQKVWHPNNKSPRKKADKKERENYQIVQGNCPVQKDLSFQTRRAQQGFSKTDENMTIYRQLLKNFRTSGSKRRPYKLPERKTKKSHKDQKSK